MGWNEAAAAHIQNSIAGTERNGMGAQCGAREGEARGEESWAGPMQWPLGLRLCQDGLSLRFPLFAASFCLRAASSIKEKVY